MRNLLYWSRNFSLENSNLTALNFADGIRSAKSDSTYSTFLCNQNRSN